MRHHTRLKRALTLGLALALTLNGVPAYAIEEVGIEEASPSTTSHDLSAQNDAAVQPDVIESDESQDDVPSADVIESDDPAQVMQLEEVPEEAADTSSNEMPFTPGLGGRDDLPQAPSIHHDGLTAQAALPSSFGAIDSSYATFPKNQSVFGTCWAFGTISAIESSILRRNPAMGYTKYSLDLSERHLAYFTYNMPADPLGNTTGDLTLPASLDYANSFETTSSYLNNGGNPLMVAYALMSRVGPVTEADASYSELTRAYNSAWNNMGTYEGFLSDTALQESIGRSGAVANLRQFKRISMADIEDVKRAVMDYGAAATNMYLDYNYMTTYKEDFVSGQYSYSGAYYRYDGGPDINHTVTIIGWDDNVHPEHGGAWLCKNSHEDGMGNIPGAAYFWLAYDDAATSTDTAYVFEMETPTPSEHVYQYDGTNSMYYNYIDAGGSIANVWRTKACQTGESLRRVSVALSSAKVDYSVQVYTDLVDSADPTSGTPQLKTPVTGTTTYAGIYMIDLPEPVQLPADSTYSVVVTLSTDDGDVEYDVDASTTDGLWYTAVSTVDYGQSFEQDAAGQSWTDLASEEADLFDEPACCARIKAYTYDAVVKRAKTSIQNAQVRVSPTSYTYDGRQKSPAITVTHDGVTLRPGTDYKLNGAAATAAGTHTVTITGVGAYEGTARATFTINKAPNPMTAKAVQSTRSLTYKASAARSLAKESVFQISGAQGTLSFQKKSGNAGITVSSQGMVTLRKALATGSYTVVFDVKASGNANYNGSTVPITITFKVAKAANTLTAKAKKAKVKASQKKLKSKALILSCNVSTKKAKGAVRYANVSKNATAKKFKVATKSGKVTIPKGTKKGTYLIKVKVSAKGNANYKAKTRTVSYRILVK